MYIYVKGQMPTGIGINASCLKDDSRDNEVPSPLSLGRALSSEAIPKPFTVCQIKSVIGFGLPCGSYRSRGRNRAMLNWQDEKPHTWRGNRAGALDEYRSLSYH